jgi:alpha-N-arabinofuranosidase
VVNIDPNHSQEVTISVRGMEATGVSGRILSSGKVQDYNSFDKPDLVKPVEFKGASLKNGLLKVVLPPVSVVVLTLK